MAKKVKKQQSPREYNRHQLSKMRKAQRRNRLVLLGGIAVIVAVVAIIFSGWLTGDYLPLHKTVVEVNGVKFDTAYFIQRLELIARAESQTQASDLSQMASGLISTITQGELEKQVSASFGVTVNDTEVDNYLKSIGMPITAASKDIAYSQILPDRLESDYFSKTVPTTDNQVDMNAIMTEDEPTAEIVRSKILNGDNITALAQQYGQGYYTQSYNGTFGFHSKSVFLANYIPEVPLDFAFGPDGVKGVVSEPLTDNVSYKQLGYWIIRVNARLSATTANVSAIYVANMPLAQSIKDQLDSGANVTALADQYTQYTDVGKGGELGIMSSSTNVSSAFNGYVYDPNVKLGVWSDPIRDTSISTKGGYWVVQVVDRRDNSPLSDADRNTLMSKAYNDWSQGLATDPKYKVNVTFPQSLQNWAVNRATNELQSSG